MTEVAPNTYCLKVKPYYLQNSQMAGVGNKPVLLSNNRYDKIMVRSTKDSETLKKEQKEEDEKYLTYLRDESNKMIEEFTGDLAQTQEEKLAGIRKRMQERNQSIRSSFKGSREVDEELRHERLERAQKLFDQLKPGPRALHSAALHSEVLHARVVQREIMEEYEKACKIQSCHARFTCKQTVLPFINQEDERKEKRTGETDKYKADLLEEINAKRKIRDEEREKNIKEAQANREKILKEYQELKDKEKAEKERKTNQFKKNIADGLKWKEQLRMREAMCNEVDDRVNCVFITGHRQLEKMKKRKLQELENIRENQRNKIAQITLEFKKKDNVGENERLERDIATKNALFLEKEAEKEQKQKKLKQERIEAHREDLKQQQVAKDNKMQHKRFELAVRLKLTEANALYDIAKKKEKLQYAKEYSDLLTKQAEEKKIIEPENMALYDTTLQYDHDDRHFFDYAHGLMMDAKEKGRPLYPFLKAVKEYKKNNQFDCPKTTVPKHLQSQLNIGLSHSTVAAPTPTQANLSGSCTPCAKNVPSKVSTCVSAKLSGKRSDSLCELFNAAKVKRLSKPSPRLVEEKSKEPTDKEIALEKCLKIQEMMIEETKRKAYDGLDTVCKSKQVCPDIPCRKPILTLARKASEDECLELLGRGNIHFSANELHDINVIRPSLPK